MYSVLDGLFLGIIQGFTEFLPVSSTGHLILLERWLGYSADFLTFDVSVHVATTLALFYYLRRDWQTIIRENRPMLLTIILASAPAALAALTIEDFLIAHVRETEVIIAGLLIGSALIVVAERKCKKAINQSRHITLWDGLIIGVFQAIALIPGISRSGSTISGGLLLGKTRLTAVRFSFLLATPIILAAAAKTLLFDDVVWNAGELPMLISGMLGAFFSAIIALVLLERLVKKHTLIPFVYYRVVLAAFLIILLLR